jgi:hypothetical protein
MLGIRFVRFHLLRAMPWLISLVGSLSPQRCGFHCGSVYVKFMVEEMTVGQVCPRQLRYFLAIIIPLMLYTFLHVISRMNGWNLGTFRQSSVLSCISGAVDRKIEIHFLGTETLYNLAAVWELLMYISDEVWYNIWEIVFTIYPSK